MRCSTFVDGDQFVLCVEDVNPPLDSVVEAAYFGREGDRFLKRFPSTVEYQDIIDRNFRERAEGMFSGRDASWEAALEEFADRCAEARIEWYATGSVCDALRGIAITPHDLDLVTHTRDFYRARDVFRDDMIEPFVDNNGSWVLRYFGRLCLSNVQIDVVADPSRNAGSHDYETVEWREHRIMVEPFEVRYRTEIERGRTYRIAAFDAFLQKQSEATTGTT